MSSTTDANTRLVRALPAPVFTLVYGAVVIGLIAGGVVLADAAETDQAAPADVGKPVRPFFPPRVDAANVEASVRPYLIADAALLPTSTGVTLTGTMTDTAEANVADFAGHVSRLLEQNCVDNMTVRSQDNLRLNLWGFCFTSPGPEAIQAYVTAGLERGADEVTFSFFPGRPAERYASLTWFADSATESEGKNENWDGIGLAGATQHLELRVIDPQTIRLQSYVRTDEGVDDHYLEFAQPR